MINKLFYRLRYAKKSVFTNLFFKSFSSSSIPSKFHQSDHIRINMELYQLAINFLSFLNLTEDQQTLEDEGIILPMKPGIPLQMQNRSQMLPPQPNIAGVMNFTTPNAFMNVGNNPAMMSYPPNYFGNQSIATPGFITNNFPATNIAPAIEPAGRRKSLIENINPFIGEKNVVSADLLSAFPVSKILNDYNCLVV